ncbi:MAG: hypothetical protein R3C28_15570 [Pirellulaceae bacterium]
MNHSLRPADIMASMFRHKGKIVFLQLLVIAVTVLAILFWPRKYYADAKLFLQIGRESIGIDPTATTGPTIGLAQLNRDSEIKSALDTLLSRSVMGAIVDSLTPGVVLGDVPLENDNGPVRESAVKDWVASVVAPVLSTLSNIDPVPEREKAIRELEETLDVEVERDSSVIYIKQVADSPELARAIVSELVKAYQREHVKAFRNDGSKDFFEVQRDASHEKLTALEQQLEARKSELGFASIGGHRSKLETELLTVENDVFLAERELAMYRGSADAIKQKLSVIPERKMTEEVDVANAGLDLLQQQLYTAQLQLVELETKLQESDPRLQRAREAVQQAERQLAQESARRTETTSDSNPIYEQLAMSFEQMETNAQGQEARLDKLKQQQADLLAKIREANQAEREITGLERDVQITKEDFLTYDNKFEESRIQEQLQKDLVSNINVIQQARSWHKPVSPSKLLLIAGGSMMVLGIPLFVGLLANLLDHSVRSEEDISQLLGTKVIGTIPRSRIYGKVWHQPIR